MDEVEKSGMEPDVKKFLVKILNTISFGVLWIIVNATLGIYLQFGFIQGGLTVTNILFYLWMIISLGILINYFYRKWK
jgi:hypothetical protein